jgi:hypothetical protein
MYIYIRKTRQFIANYLVIKKQIKKIFDMVKVTKSSPIFKQSRAKKVCTIVYQSVTNFDLTAMPPGGDVSEVDRWVIISKQFSDWNFHYGSLQTFILYILQFGKKQVNLHLVYI